MYIPSRQERECDEHDEEECESSVYYEQEGWIKGGTWFEDGREEIVAV